jgi:5'-nucleotidase
VALGTVINYRHKAEGFPMKILVTNDDGIHSEGLWTLVRKLKKIAQITVITPDSERSAIGTAVSLLQPVKIEEVTPAVSGVTAYTVDGTPSDCVILALGKLIKDRVDLVISGINNGSNLGEDVYISGTVGAALQGYFRGSSALAISAPRNSNSGLETAAKVVALLAERITTAPQLFRIFLNVNVPDLPPAEIAGTKITRLASTSHINTVEEDGQGQQKYYHLIRQQVSNAARKGTDIYAKEHGFISITPLFTSLYDRPPQRFLNSLCAGLLEQLQN